MSGGFKRSTQFGLIGIFVVAAIVVVIATQTGQGEANPKTKSFVPLLIGGPLIVGAAIWGSIRALIPGGEIDAATTTSARRWRRWGSRSPSGPRSTSRCARRRPTASARRSAVRWC